MNQPDVNAAVTRLFALVGVPVPQEGTVVLDFHEGELRKIRPQPVITIPSSKGIAAKDRRPA